jgi:hypothetical protein
MSYIGKNLSARIKDYGLDRETFKDWCVRFGDASLNDKYKNIPDLVFDGHNLNGVSVSPLMSLCRVLMLDFAEAYNKDSVAPLPTFGSEYKAIDKRYHMLALELLDLADYFTDLMSIERHLDEDMLLLHKVLLDDISVGFIALESAAENMIAFYSSDSYIHMSPFTREILRKKSREFSLTEGEPCDISPVMDGELGILICKAGHAGAIGHGRVRELLRTR